MHITLDNYAFAQYPPHLEEVAERLDAKR